MENKIQAITDAIIEGDFEVTKLKMAFSGFDTLDSFIKYSILTKYAHIPYHSYSQFRVEFEKSYFANTSKINSISELVDEARGFCEKYKSLVFENYVSYGKSRKYHRKVVDLLFKPKVDSNLDECLSAVNEFALKLNVTYMSPVKIGEIIKLCIMLSN